MAPSSEKVAMERTAASCVGSESGTLDQTLAPKRLDRDRRLVEALRLAEPTAAENLVASYGGRAYRLAIGITGNQPDAEEVVQDALWTVVRKIDTFRSASAFSSWLYRIVANVAHDKLRGRKGQLGDCSLDEISAIVAEDGESVTDWSSWSRDPVLETDLRIVLTAAIEALPAHYRTVVILRDVEGLSPQETAQITGLSVANVKTRTLRARLVLRKRLGMYHCDLAVFASECGNSRKVNLPAHGRREGAARKIAERPLACPFYGQPSLGAPGEPPPRSAVTAGGSAVGKARPTLTA